MRLPTLRLEVTRIVSRILVIPLAKSLNAMHISANMLTIAGLLLTCSAGYLVSEGFFLYGALILLLGSSMDMLDGALARLSGSSSSFGAFLDSTSDRLGEAILLFGLLIHYTRQDEASGIYMVFGALVASFMVSYSRARAEGLGVAGDVGLMGRPERLLVLIIGLLLGLPLYSLGIVLAFSITTAIQRLWHVYRSGDNKS